MIANVMSFQTIKKIFAHLVVMGAVFVASICHAQVAADRVKYFVQASQLNVREAPDSNSKVVALLKINDEVEILVKPPNASRCEIRIIATAQSGWINCSFIESTRITFQATGLSCD
jgi:uncharacterized protein YgiM (DUF1202 family)